MGDRGNVHAYSTKSGGKNGGVWFYTHWKGSELPDIVKTALLKGRDRWGDEPYLNRIIFCEMVDGDEGTAGFGISTYMDDNQNPVVEIDHEYKNVAINGETWTFKDFIGIPLAVGDEVQRVWPFDGTDKAGKPYGPPDIIMEIRDYAPLDGPTEKGPVAMLSDNSWELLSNLRRPLWNLRR